MPLVGAYILPHGGIPLAPEHFKTKDESAKKKAQELHDAAFKAGESIRSLKPDLILLSTPHGVADLTLVEFYLSAEGHGFADTDNLPPHFMPLTVKLAPTEGRQITEQLQQQGHKVSGLSGFGKPGSTGQAKPFPLGWGEVIPMHFAGCPHTPVIMMAMALSRYETPTGTNDQLLKLGNSLSTLLNDRPERIVVITSADLAHRFQADGPFGYSEASKYFDDAVDNWVRTLDGKQLTEVAGKYVAEAYSCGYTGMVMLQGILASNQTQIKWRSQLLASCHPSYYGMMVAEFLPE